MDPIQSLAPKLKNLPTFRGEVLEKLVVFPVRQVAGLVT